MILHCSFEELTAATAAAGRVLEGTGTGGVAAPPQVIADIEALLPRLVGDLSLDTLAEVRSFKRAVDYMLSAAHLRTDAFIIDQHPASEAAVASYFEYAHILTLADRARRIDAQMRALIELMSGAAVTEESAARYQFPD
jgi:hypothetical protein